MAGTIVEIADAASPAVVPFAKIRERDLVGRQGLFVAEGEVVVRVLIERSRFRVRSLLLGDKRVDAMRDVIAKLPEGTPVHVAPQRVMDEVVGFPIHRGVLALGERGDDLNANELLLGGLVVGLVGLTNHDNVGGIFRSASAFGAKVLHDPGTCDPLYRKAVRVSTGAALTVPFAPVPSAYAMIDLLEGAGFGVLALSARGDETLDAAARDLDKCALLLGTEGAGLPNDVLERTRRVRIPMRPGLDSLNVAVAASIALYEVTRTHDASR